MAFGVTRDPVSGAIKSNAAATGKKRYGAGLSTAATTGPLDPQGYEEREARKRARKRVESRRFSQMAGGSAPMGASAYTGR